MKGFVHSIEVIIAASILLIGIAVLFRPYATTNINDMKTQGYEVLRYLDDSGFLREAVRTQKKEVLSEKISELIDYNAMIDICKTGCTPPILKKNIVVVEYYVSGYPDESGLRCDPYKITLYLW